MDDFRTKGFALAAFFIAISNLVLEVKKDQISLKDMRDVFANARYMANRMAKDLIDDSDGLRRADELLQMAETMFAAAAAEPSPAGSH